MKEAIGYVRVSTEKQAKEGISLDAQESKIKAYCTLSDLRLLRLFKDEGISGSKRRRPGLIKAMNAVKEVQGTLIVYSLSRFSRSVKDCTDLSEELNKSGCNFVSLSESIDTGSAMGRFFFHVMSALGALERELTIERLKTTQDYKREKGERMGRFRRYGYNVVEGQDMNAKGKRKNVLVPLMEEQNVISRIINDVKSGKHYAVIAEELNDSGITSAQGGNWHAKTVRGVYLRESRMSEQESD